VEPRNNFPAAPAVIVPDDERMATEPAEVIARAHQIRVGLAALLSVAGIVLAPELVEQIDELIQVAITVGFGLYAWWNNYKQGRETREAVYAPATVATIAEAANKAGQAAKRTGVATGDPAQFDLHN
jgi:hypothetical protein